MQYSIFNYRHSVVQQVSRTSTSCTTETLSPLNTNSSFLPPFHRGQPSTFHFYEFEYFRYLIEVESRNIYPSVSGSFHVAQYSQSSSMFSYMAGTPFLWLNNILANVYTTSLFIHVPVDRLFPLLCYCE